MKIKIIFTNNDSRDVEITNLRFYELPNFIIQFEDVEYCKYEITRREPDCISELWIGNEFDDMVLVDFIKYFEVDND